MGKHRDPEDDLDSDEQIVDSIERGMDKDEDG